ncbi:MAG: transcriptional regulator, partial [Bacteroidetes bacterium]
LGDRLKKLEEVGIISRGEDSVKKSRIRYSLTRKGIDLLPILIEMIVWGGFNDELTEAPEEFLEQATQNREAMIQQIRVDLIKEHISD